jgi:hypothetical protein
LAAIKGLDEDGFEKRDRRRLAPVDMAVLIAASAKPA